MLDPGRAAGGEAAGVGAAVARLAPPPGQLRGRRGRRLARQETKRTAQTGALLCSLQPVYSPAELTWHDLVRMRYSVIPVGLKPSLSCEELLVLVERVCYFVG